MNLESLRNLIADETAIAVYFSSPNCGVCHALLPKVEHMFSERFPMAKLVLIQTEKSPEICGAFGVFSAPTLVVFFEGKEFLRKVRNMGIDEIRKKIERPYKIIFS